MEVEARRHDIDQRADLSIRTIDFAQFRWRSLALPHDPEVRSVDLADIGDERRGASSKVRSEPKSGHSLPVRRLAGSWHCMTSGWLSGRRRAQLEMGDY